MAIFVYTIGVLVLLVPLVIFSYLDRAHREMGRVSTGRFREHLDIFESEIEPRFRMDRRRANLVFSVLSRFWLVAVAVTTAQAILEFVPELWQDAVELIVILGAEVVVAMYFLPNVLLARTSGRWMKPLVPFVRVLTWIVLPVVWVLEVNASILHLAEDSESAEGGAGQPEQEALEALVEVATEEGIIERDEARLIEQVVEFHDKRVRELMTPRPDIVSIPITATIEQFRRLLIETKHSRLPVYDKSLDEICGIVVGRDILSIPDREASHRTVAELVRPALFVPETKLGSELLKEMQQKKQQLAIVIDEYGLVAGVVTVEDLVEEIVGEIREEGDRSPAPDVIREGPSTIVMRGSLSVAKLEELFGIHVGDEHENLGSGNNGRPPEQRCRARTCYWRND